MDCGGRLDVRKSSGIVSGKGPWRPRASGALDYDQLMDTKPLTAAGRSGKLED
jgi:hypothetical protein